MPQRRFFAEDPLLVDSEVSLKDKELHHLRVMRLQQEEILELVNGKGILAQALVLEMDKERALCKVVARKEDTPLASELILGLPMMRSSKLEWVLEKGTELGVDQFWIYTAKHSDKENFSLKERVFSLLVAALKQSGRLYLPQVSSFSSLENMLEHFSLPFFYGDFTEKRASFEESCEKCLFITGPEKGFSTEEKKVLKKRGKAVRLSPFILRAETAPLAFASIFRNQTFQ